MAGGWLTIPTRHWQSVDAVLPFEEGGVSRDTELRWAKASLFIEDWHADARCATLANPKDADAIFFDGGDEAKRPTFTITQINEVKRFCHGCPVFADCLTHALTKPERHGIWAGTSKRTRQRILALVDAGQVTVRQVVDDYLQGRGKRYESLRRAS